MKTLKTSFKGDDKLRGWAGFFFLLFVFLAVEAGAAFVCLLVGGAGFVPPCSCILLLYFTAITLRTREQWALYFNIILSSLVFRTHSDSTTFPHFYGILMTLQKDQHLK